MIEYYKYGPGEGPKENFHDFVMNSDNLFCPSLSSRVDLETYIKKMYDNGTKQIYIENGAIIGLSVSYINKAPNYSFGTYLLILPEYEGYGLGLAMVKNNLKYAKEIGCKEYRLRIRASNKMLYKFYKSMGFIESEKIPYEGTDEFQYEMIKYF